MKTLPNGVVFMQDGGTMGHQLKMRKSLKDGQLVINHGRQGYGVFYRGGRLICQTQFEDDALFIADAYAKKESKT